jgi:hypothetical protein
VVTWDPLYFAVALGPLAVYLLLLGLINASRRPFLTTGTRDVAALGVAISGFVFAGPMELFMPQAAVNRFGGYVWLLLLAFYVLSLTLIVLAMRPRIVIYNISVEQLRPTLAEVVGRLDSEARWAGDSLVLPKLGVQLSVETQRVLCNAQLIAVGSQQSYAGWRRLELQLRDALRDVRTCPNPHGYVLISLGLLMLSALTFWMVRDVNAVAQSLRDILRL